MNRGAGVESAAAGERPARWGLTSFDPSHPKVSTGF